jgi:hypothetical protein
MAGANPIIASIDETKLFAHFGATHRNASKVDPVGDSQADAAQPRFTI